MSSNITEITKESAKETFVRCVHEWIESNGEEDKKEDAISAAVEYASVLGLTSTNFRSLYKRATGNDLADVLNQKKEV